MALTDREIAIGWGAFFIAAGFGMLAAAALASEGLPQAGVTAVTGFAFLGTAFVTLRTGEATRRHAEFVIVIVGLFLVVNNFLT